VLCESTHNLLTLDGGTLYYNTNLGAVAAIRTDDGWPLWVSLYPRARRGNLAKLAPHWRRDLTPCVLDHGRLLVAPADTPRIFALDSATGQPLWQTGSEVEDAVQLLGAADPWLIAGGRRLYWISMREEDRGRVKHVWPDGADHSGYGRGILAGDTILWPTRDKLYIFDRQTAVPLKTIDLAARGASGGNLLVIDRRLLIATSSELIAIGALGGRPDQNPEPSTGAAN
jgi:outer membrane protein assembly factor BamB